MYYVCDVLAGKGRRLLWFHFIAKRVVQSESILVLGILVINCKCTFNRRCGYIVCKYGSILPCLF